MRWAEVKRSGSAAARASAATTRRSIRAREPSQAAPMSAANSATAEAGLSTVWARNAVLAASMALVPSLRENRRIGILLRKRILAILTTLIAICGKVYLRTAHEHLDGDLGAVLCSQPALELPMQENFRQFLARLRQAAELFDLHQPVDIRHIATLVDQARTALYSHKVIGYEMPVVSGLIRSRERAIMSLG